MSFKIISRKDEVENEMAATRVSSNEARIEQLDLEGTVIYATKFIADLGRRWSKLSMVDSSFECWNRFAVECEKLTTILRSQEEGLVYIGRFPKITTRMD